MSVAASPLSAAAQANDTARLRALLEDGSVRDVNERDADGRTALHWAASLNAVECLDVLLAVRNIDVSSSDATGWTPLISASSAGHASVVSSLLRARCEVDAATRAGRTALSYAASKGHAAVVHQLLEHGCEPNLADRRGNTPLHFAAVAGAPAVVSLLVQAGAATTRGDGDGNTPAHLAASELLGEPTSSARLEVLRCLVRAGHVGACANAEGVRVDALLSRLPEPLRRQLDA